VLGSCRTLFSIQSLGLDGFEKQRHRVTTQFDGMADKFKAKMTELSQSETSNMIFTEDLKNMCHLVDNKPEDLALMQKMMKR